MRGEKENGSKEGTGELKYDEEADNVFMVQVCSF